jgi:hypothetical protein
MEQQEPKPKRVMTEEQLRKMAEGRLRGLETRRKNAQIKQTIKQEKHKKLDEDYESIVLKKGQKQQDVAPPQHAPPPPEKPKNAVIQEQSDDDEPEVTSKPMKQKKEPVVSYKELYYKQKLEALQASQQQQQFNQNYGQMPVQNHAIDIAKHNLKSKANQLVYDSVMKSLFPMG